MTKQKTKKKPVGRIYQLTVLLNSQERRALDRYLKIVGADGNEQSRKVREILFSYVNSFIQNH